MGWEPSRRDLIKTAGAIAGGAALASVPEGVLRAMAAAPAAGLKDIDHIIISIQENRSFDHYFGTYRGVRGFDDRSVTQADGSPIFNQRGYPGAGDRLVPFHIDTNQGGECTPDVSHTWIDQHLSLNGGRNDMWLPTHVKSDGAAVGPSVMGYYTATTFPTTTRSRTTSRCATTTSARWSAPPIPTISTTSAPPSTPRARAAGRS